MILANFYQKFLPKYKNFGQSGARAKEVKNYVFFLLIACSKFAPKCIHQIPVAKIQNFPASEGGTSPVRHLPGRAIGTDTPLKSRRQIYPLAVLTFVLDFGTQS